MKTLDIQKSLLTVTFAGNETNPKDLNKPKQKFDRKKLAGFRNLTFLKVDVAIETEIILRATPTKALTEKISRLKKPTNPTTNNAEKKNFCKTDLPKSQAD